MCVCVCNMCKDHHVSDGLKAPNAGEHMVRDFRIENVCVMMRMCRARRILCPRLCLRGTKPYTLAKQNKNK